MPSVNDMTPEEIKRRLPDAPDEAIKQMIALDRHQRELLAHRNKDITILFDYLEEYFRLIQRWVPAMLKPEFERVVGEFGTIICKDNKACIEEFEQTLRKLIQLAEIKD
jgi:hypothetical protein